MGIYIFFSLIFYSKWASQVAQWVKNTPAMQEMQEMQIQSLGGEDPLEKEMATHSKSLMDRGTWRATVQDTT